MPFRTLSFFSRKIRTTGYLPKEADGIKKKPVLTEDLFLCIEHQTLFGTIVFVSGKVAYFNKTAAALTKLDTDVLSLYKLQDFAVRIHIEDRDRFLKQFDNSEPAEATDDKHNEIRFYDGNGVCRYWNVFVNPLYFGGNQGHMLIFTDISYYKETENALKVSEEKYRRLLQTSPDAIVVSDKEGRLLFVSDKTFSLFGYEPDFPYQGIPLYEFVTPEHKNAVKIALQELKNGTGTYKDGEYTLLRKDGSVFFEEINSAILNGCNGEANGIISVIRDITQRKIIEKELIRSKNKAEEADRLKTAFLSNMSHEIRTPMNAIVGFAELLTDPDLTEDKKLEYIGIIKSHGDSLLHLIDDILDLAKIEAGQLKIRKVCFRLSEITREVLMAFQEQLYSLGKTDIELRTKFYPSCPETLLSDPARLRQILNNLLSNAVKFTHQGYIEVGIYTQTISHQEFVVFYVEDSGIGMDSEKIPLIFDRFTQLDDSNARLYPGTGLGLAITRNIVQLLGGFINVDSQKNIGTRFSVFLPNEQNHQTSQIMLSGVESKNIPDWSAKTIILAEDEPANLYYLQEILQKTGITVYPAGNGEEAVRLCRLHPETDLVLMDIKMPVMDGFTATRLIKQFRPDIPVIAQTAYAMHDDEERCLREGCDAYIAKPVFQDALFARLAPFLNK
jgi:PAS domain S-box-containing protein